MVMETLQIRLSKGLLKEVDGLVKTEIYANRSDAIRDAVRRLVLDRADFVPHDEHSVHKKLDREMKIERTNMLAH